LLLVFLTACLLLIGLSACFFTVAALAALPTFGASLLTALVALLATTASVFFHNKTFYAEQSQKKVPQKQQVIRMTDFI
jgi:hypothetical protein